MARPLADLARLLDDDHDQVADDRERRDQDHDPDEDSERRRTSFGRHGERYRHDAILAADSEAIFYLCDDDHLLLWWEFVTPRETGWQDTDD